MKAPLLVSRRNEAPPLLQRIEGLPAGVWDRIAAADPAATVFHTRPWAESALASYPRARVATEAFLLSDGAIAVLPRMERRIGPFRILESAPDALYGGPIAERPLADAEVAMVLARTHIGRASRFAIRGNPYREWTQPGVKQGQGIFTQTVDLSPGYEAVFSRFHTTCRRNIRLGQRYGLQVEAASRESDYFDYYAAYQDTLKRWGKRASFHVSLRRFLSLRDHLGANLRLWLVRREGRVLGGNCVLYHNDRAYYWHGAFFADAFKFRAANFLQAEVIREGCQRGILSIDLGTSRGMQGVIHFKETFGATRLYFDGGILHESQVFRSARRIRTSVRRLTGL